MASEIDARLTKFGPRDVTVLGTNGLLRVLPHAEALPPVTSMAEVTATLLGGPHPAVVQRAEALVAAERKAHAVQNELEETKTQLELVRVINILLIYSSANNINLT